MQEGLYQLIRKSFDPAILSKVVNKADFSFVSIVKEQKENLLWHFHLGHVSWKKLGHVSEVKNHEILPPCNICHLSKQHRIVLPVTQKIEKRILALLYMDIWGPYYKKSMTGANYILIVVNDFSRSLWTILLQSKSQVLTVIQKLLKKLENQF